MRYNDGKKLEKASIFLNISCLFTVLLRIYILPKTSLEYNCTKKYLIFYIA